MKTHIRVKQRAEDEGIGHEKVKVEQASTNWWQGAVNDTLAKLNQSGSSSSSKKSKKSKKDKSRKKKSKKVAQIKTYTDEELFVATGGARFGMRAQRKQEGKWARAENGISQEEELSAMAAVEWNGTGKAKFASDLLLSGSKKRRGLEVLGEQGDELMDRRTKDKKRKREISTDDDDDDVLDAKTLEDHNNAEIDENKKSKKDKTKKKKKKKSKQDDEDSGESSKKKKKKKKVDRVLNVDQ